MSSKLKGEHSMLSRIHNKLGTAGLIVAVVALVAALVGSAYAASGGSFTKKQKKEIQKIAKKFAGATGPAGPAGSPGAAGKNGTNGTNGSAGPTGPTGFSGFTETLPTEKTETGAWSAGAIAESEQYPGPGNFLHVSLPFAIPLASELDYAHTHLIWPNGKEKVVVITLEPFSQEEKEVTVPACSGTAAAPSADPGNLCIYAKNMEDIKNTNVLVDEVPQGSAPIHNPGTEELGASVAGAMLNLFPVNETTKMEAFGTWAVTAE